MNFLSGLMGDRFKQFLGDLARPYAIYSAATSYAASCIILSVRGVDLNAAGWFIGAMGATLTGLYAGKVIENRGIRKAEAEVEIARADRRDGSDRRQEPDRRQSPAPSRHPQSKPPWERRR